MSETEIGRVARRLPRRASNPEEAGCCGADAAHHEPRQPEALVPVHSDRSFSQPQTARPERFRRSSPVIAASGAHVVVPVQATKVTSVGKMSSETADLARRCLPIRGAFRPGML